MSHNTTGSVPFHEQLSFATQIGNGLKHLESLKIVHRDVAAFAIPFHQCNIHSILSFASCRRNMLLTRRNGSIQCKISDFGLARNLVYRGLYNHFLTDVDHFIIYFEAWRSLTAWFVFFIMIAFYRHVSATQQHTPALEVAEHRGVRDVQLHAQVGHLVVWCHFVGDCQHGLHTIYRRYSSKFYHFLLRITFISHL